MSDITRTGTAVDQPGSVLLFHERDMIVRADQDIHALQALQQVKALGLQDRAVTIARGGVRQRHDNVGMLLFANAVHPLLRTGD